MPFVIVMVFGAGLAAATLAWGLPPWVGALYGALSLLCFAAYAQDKAAARAGRRRTPESALLLLGLAGGWPGAVLAQQWLRHKNAKAAFQWRFWLTVFVNACALAWAALAQLA
jgi:uncharacterized membrane protein YsdA (DUF1294 family)